MKIPEPYFMKTAKPKKLSTPGFPKQQRKVEPEPEEAPIGLVQGKIPQSKEEWRVANALWKLGIPFQFQVDFAGGSQVRGGQVIDFLVMTVPLPTPLYVQGTYFHPLERRGEDEYKQRKLRLYTRGTYAMPKEVFDYEIPTMEAAYQRMKEMFA